MRTTCQKPVESLSPLDSIRLADDPRRFRILSIEPPAGASDRYRISLQSEDGLATVLNCDGEEFVTVWVREVPCPYRVEPVPPCTVPQRLRVEPRRERALAA